MVGLLAGFELLDGGSRLKNDDTDGLFDCLGQYTFHVTVTFTHWSATFRALGVMIVSVRVPCPY